MFKVDCTFFLLGSSDSVFPIRLVLLTIIFCYVEFWAYLWQWGTLLLGGKASMSKLCLNDVDVFFWIWRMLVKEWASCNYQKFTRSTTSICFRSSCDFYEWISITVVFIWLWRTWNHLERAALLFTALWKKKMQGSWCECGSRAELSLIRKILHFIPSSLLPTSRGFLVYMMVRFILSGLPGHIYLNLCWSWF